MHQKDERPQHQHSLVGVPKEAKASSVAFVYLHIMKEGFYVSRKGEKVSPQIVYRVGDGIHQIQITYQHFVETHAFCLGPTIMAKTIFGPMNVKPHLSL